MLARQDAVSNNSSPTASPLPLSPVDSEVFFSSESTTPNVDPTHLSADWSQNNAKLMRSAPNVGMEPASSPTWGYPLAMDPNPVYLRHRSHPNVHRSRSLKLDSYDENRLNKKTSLSEPGEEPRNVNINMFDPFPCKERKLKPKVQLSTMFSPREDDPCLNNEDLYDDPDQLSGSDLDDADDVYIRGLYDDDGDDDDDGYADDDYCTDSNSNQSDVDVNDPESNSVSSLEPSAECLPNERPLEAHPTESNDATPTGSSQQVSKHHAEQCNAHKHTRVQSHTDVTDQGENSGCLVPPHVKKPRNSVDHKNSIHGRENVGDTREDRLNEDMICADPINRSDNGSNIHRDVTAESEYDVNKSGDTISQSLDVTDQSGYTNDSSEDALDTGIDPMSSLYSIQDGAEPSIDEPQSARSVLNQDNIPPANNRNTFVRRESQSLDVDNNNRLLLQSVESPPDDSQSHQTADEDDSRMSSADMRHVQMPAKVGQSSSNLSHVNHVPRLMDSRCEDQVYHDLDGLNIDPGVRSRAKDVVAGEQSRANSRRLSLNDGVGKMKNVLSSGGAGSVSLEFNMLGSGLHTSGDLV